MSADDEMTIDERYEYLRRMKKRHFDAGRKQPGGLLSETKAVSGLKRKGFHPAHRR